MEIVMQQAKSQKNTNGQFGPKCNNCGGFGFTLGFGGKDSGCHYCDQTGVATATNADLAQRLVNLESEILGLKNIIMKELGKQ